MGTRDSLSSRASRLFPALLFHFEPGGETLVCRITAGHPRRGPDLREPVGDGGNASAAILLHMLLGDVPDRNVPALGIHDGFAEDALRLEDALRVMAQRAVPEVGIGFLRGIQPIMDGQVIGNAAA